MSIVLAAVLLWLLATLCVLAAILVAGWRIGRRHGRSPENRSETNRQPAGPGSSISERSAPGRTSRV